VKVFLDQVFPIPLWLFREDEGAVGKEQVLYYRRIYWGNVPHGTRKLEDAHSRPPTIKRHKITLRREVDVVVG